MPTKKTIRQRLYNVDSFGLHPSPLLNRIYSARGIEHPEQVDLQLQQLLRPDALLHLDAAVALLVDALARQLRIVVIGDFDCDGATGTAVAVRGLRMLGAQQVFFRVPHRVRHGYGLTPGLVDELADMQPELIITVDSGIACIPGIEAANVRGYRVLVTDHHLPGEKLPPAEVIVNPNLPGCGFESKALAGVGVVFYLLLAVRRQLRQQGLPGAQADLSSLLDLVAIGSIADMVKLDANNRRLVRAGIARIHSGRCQPGVSALLVISGLAHGKITATDIGFRIAPKINAAGRLEDMALGIECLLADDPTQAMAMAESLHVINLERQELQQGMLDEAEQVLSTLDPQCLDGQRCILLHQPHWHPGIIGLLASRVKDRWHRPVLAFAANEAGSSELRGSCRSIPGFHIRDALALVDAQHPGLIQRFGGHAMAAGLSLDAQHLDAFSNAFATVVADNLDMNLLEALLLTDGPLVAEQLTRETAVLLQESGPWGQGFPVPLFDNVFSVSGWQVLKDKHLKLQLLLPDSARLIDAIFFNGYHGEAPPAMLRAVYELQTNDFRDKCGFQCLIHYIEPA